MAGSVVIPAASSGGTPGGSDTQVQFNNRGAFGASANFVYDNTVGILTLGSEPLVITGSTIDLYPSTGGARIILTGPGTAGLDSAAITFEHATNSSPVGDWSIFINDQGTDVYDWALMDRTDFTYKIQAFKGTAGELKLNQSGGLVSIGAGGLTVGGTAVTATLKPTDIFFDGGTIGPLSSNATGFYTLSAYDVDGAAYATFATLTNGNTPNLTITPPTGGTVNLKGVLATSANATTGLTAGVLAALTNASIVITDGTGQVYRVPCII